MLNHKILAEVLKGYKEQFPVWIQGERYKWEAIQHFQDHWDITAKDFTTMLDKSLKKTENLLSSHRNYPLSVIKEFSRTDPETIRTMFDMLFDETRDLADRVSKFQNNSEAFRVENNPGSWKQHYQKLNSISIYLWLRYPEKYYIFKITECETIAKIIESDIKPKRGQDPRNLINGFKLYDQIYDVVVKDKELINLLDKHLPGKDFSDLYLKTLVVDLGYYVNFISKHEKNKSSGHEISTTPSKNNSMIFKTKPPENKNTNEISDQELAYWWLNANPKIWSYSEIGVNEVQSYTLYNENNNKRKIFKNFLDAKKGDLVIGYEAHPVKQVVALGRINEANDGERLYFEKLESLTMPIDYATLKASEELKNMEGFPTLLGSLLRMTKDEYDFVIDLIREQNPLPRPGEPIEKYTKKDFLEEVYMSRDDLEALLSLLHNKKNLILQGAPGVGKTFLAKRLAYVMMGGIDEHRIELIQFHQNYSYEDFVMGYKPDEDGFSLKQGIFYQFCQKAANNPNQPYFFIIDEINRGNMSKIFGELLMLIERDYRGTKATLAYSGMTFSVPKNVYLIGMMNTADRSLAMIDYALRRRFGFFEMTPAFENEQFLAYQQSLENETFNSLISKLKELNREISSDDSLGSGFQIGHSYFSGQEECTDEWMKEVIYFEILPMLKEYWFDDPRKVQQWETNLSVIFND